MGMPTINLSGDATHGWIADMHDGESHMTAFPVAATEADARTEAVAAWDAAHMAVIPAAPAPAVAAIEAELADAQAQLAEVKNG